MTLLRLKWRLNAKLSHALCFVARAGISAINEARLPEPTASCISIPASPISVSCRCLRKPRKKAAPRDFPAPAPAALAVAGSPDDPRTQEAMRLIEAFLAIEDATARSSLIALAERLVSYDWLRKVQQR